MTQRRFWFAENEGCGFGVNPAVFWLMSLEALHLHLPVVVGGWCSL